LIAAILSIIGLALAVRRRRVRAAAH
jgi:hypothetical protein